MRPLLPDTTTPQAQSLDCLSAEVDKLDDVFQEAQRNREIHQKRLNEMIQDTLRQIQKARSHMQQKSKHVRDTTVSFTAKFEHELSCAQELLRREMEEVVVGMDEGIDVLEVRIGELEGDLKTQHQLRMTHLETCLGPIRDECKRLTETLEEERRARRQQENKREKLLADEVEKMTKLIDDEKSVQEQQLAEYHKFVDAEQQKIAKRQYQIEKETKQVAAGVRNDLQKAVKERVVCQAKVVESIASFVKRYREQMGREVDLHNDKRPNTGHTQGQKSGTGGYG